MSNKLIPIGNGYSYSKPLHCFVILKTAKFCYDCFFFNTKETGCFFKGEAQCEWNKNYKSVSFWLYLDEEESL